MIAVASFASLGGFLFLTTIYLQEMRRLTPLHAGLYTLPVAAMTVLVSPFAGRLVGPRPPDPAAAGRRLVLGILPLTRLARTPRPGCCSPASCCSGSASRR